MNGAARELGNAFDWFGDVFWLTSGTKVVVSRPSFPLPPSHIERAVQADTVYLGTNAANGDAVVIVVVGETAIRVELSRLEAFFYGGMLTGSTEKVAGEDGG